MADTLSARDIVEMLRRHYLPNNRTPAGVFAAEIDSPCGTRRADLIWLPITVSGGASRRRTELVGHEVKVSRADVQVELADLTKADPWLRYCTRWWLTLSDASLVDGLDIPAAWGIMAPPSGRRTRTMTVIRPAPQLHPTNQAAGLARLATWQFWRAHNAEGQMRDRLDSAERELAWVRDAARADQTMRLDPAAKRVTNIINLVNARMHDADIWGRDVTDEDVAGAIVDINAARFARDQLDRVIRTRVAELKRAFEPLRVSYGPLAKILADLEADRG